VTPKLINYLASSNPCIFIPTVEDTKAELHILDSMRSMGCFVDRELCIWKVTTGMDKYKPGTWTKELIKPKERPVMEFITSLNYVASTPRTIGIFYHIRGLLKEATVVQSIIDAAYQAKKIFSTIIFIGAFLDLPPELYNIVTFCEFPLPTKEELETLCEKLMKTWENTTEFPKSKKKRKEIFSKSASSALGLDLFSAENAMALAVSMTEEFNSKIIQSQKEQHIKKSDILEYIRTDINLAEVGGFEALKRWLDKRKEAFSDKAREYGLPWPKGILLVGPPGCLSADAEILIANPSRHGGRLLTIEQLYYRFNNLHKEAVSKGILSNYRKNWDGREEYKTYSIDETTGLVQLNKISGVVYSGIKEVYQITTNSGSTIKSTKDHKFYTEQGAWVALEYLQVGDKLVVRKDGPLLKDYSTGRNKIASYREHNMIMGKIQSIKSIDYIGEENTYDIQMETPRNNFIANNFVVHNSGKSHCSKAIASFLELPLLRLDLGSVFGRYVGTSEENMRRALHIVEAISPCLTGETIITLPSGEDRTIENLFKDTPYKFRVPCMLDDCSMSTTLINCITKRSVSIIYDICLKHSSIKTTAEHLHPVFRDGELVWTRAEHLAEGDMIAMPKKLPSGNDTTLDIIDFIPEETRLYFTGAMNCVKSSVNIKSRKYRKSDFVKLSELKSIDDLPSLEDIQKFSKGRGGTASSELYTLPTHISSDLGYLLGLLSSDGYIGKRRIRFVNTEEELHRQFNSIFHNLFNLIPSTLTSNRGPEKFYKDDLKVSVYQPCFTNYVDNLLLASILKNIQANILKMPQHILESWIQGCFDGDGYVANINNNPKIVITSKVPAVNKIIRSILHRIGFPTLNKDYFNIEICGYSKVVKFIQQVGSRHPKKIEKMQTWLGHNGLNTLKSRDDLIPVGNLLLQARAEAGLSSTQFGTIGSSSILSYEKGIRHPNRERVTHIINILKTKTSSSLPLKRLEQLCNGDLMWTPITKITTILEETDVYDLVCEKDHNFIANGIMTHNCILWIDEIDKAMAGMESSGKTDSGVTARVLSTLLTWRQETTKPVFMVCTANDPDMMPSMVYRKGRLDEVWAVELPTVTERKMIFSIHLKKRGRNPDNFNLEILGQKTNNFTGAEIEAAVEDAMFSSFYEGVELTTNHILASIYETIPQSNSEGEDMIRIREWMKQRARAVSLLEADSNTSLPKGISNLSDMRKNKSKE
jgi:intein/homing endonuclease/ATP-dependent 26S proteasome regulatory subunit